MTLQDLCDQEGVGIEDALAALEKAMITAEPGDNLRDLAEGVGLTPREIVEVINQ